VDVADEVANVTAAVEQGDHGVLDTVFGGGVIGIDSFIPDGPKGFEGLLGLGEHGCEFFASGFEIFASVGVGIQAHLFKSHVELKGLFEEVGRGHLFLGGAGGLGEVGGGAGLLFELDAFEGEEILGAGYGFAEGAVGIVELGAGGKRGVLFFCGAGGEAVRVQLARLRVEGLLERREIEVQVLRKVEEGEVVCVAHQVSL
jgi:hypothetical protein